MANRQKILKVALDTLGCKLNQAETGLLARKLTEAGYRIVSPSDQADIYILNTCTVTHIADRKSRHLLRAEHQKNPTALIIATGCYAQRAPHELSRIDGVSLVLGNSEKANLVALIDNYQHPASPTSAQEAAESKTCPRTRAFVKVQDGCSNFCAYCIVPLVRGREQSLPASQIAAEVKEQVNCGYKEVVLTGTEIGSYSHGSVNLKGLIERILSETCVPRLRLSSLQPPEISAELIGLWDDRRLCRHFQFRRLCF